MLQAAMGSRGGYVPNHFWQLKKHGGRRQLQLPSPQGGGVGANEEVHYIFYTIYYYILLYYILYIILHYILYVLAVTYAERCAAKKYHRRLENKGELLTTSK